MAKYLDPKSDIVFKKIFGQHPHLLKSFLNAILPLPEDGLIDTLEYLPSEQIPDVPAFKRTIVDVKCKDVQGRIFIVEMQVEWTDGFMQRLLFSSSQAYVRQLQKGEDYRLLNPVYGLGLVADIFDKETPNWYHHYKVVNVEEPKRTIDGLQLVFIELPKFKPAKISEKKLQVLWLRFMAEINEETREVEPSLLAVPEIKEAIELSQQAGYSVGELASYDAYWDAVRTEKTLLKGRFEEGLKTGEEIGLEKGEQIGYQKAKVESENAQHNLRMDIAKNLLVTGLSLDQIVEITKLSISELKAVFKD